MKRRSPYDIVAAVYVEVQQNPSMNINALSKKVDANWCSVRSSLDALERHKLYVRKKH